MSPLGVGDAILRIEQQYSEPVTKQRQPACHGCALYIPLHCKLTLHQTLWLLSKNLDVQAKLRDEVADLIGRKREPSMDDLNSLPYLTAVVKCVLSASLSTNLEAGTGKA